MLPGQFVAFTGNHMPRNGAAISSGLSFTFGKKKLYPFSLGLVIAWNRYCHREDVLRESVAVIPRRAEEVVSRPGLL